MFSLQNCVKMFSLFSFQLPHDFSALFNATLFKLDTSILPDVIRYMYCTCMCIHDIHSLVVPHKLYASPVGSRCFFHMYVCSSIQTKQITV